MPKTKTQAQRKEGRERRQKEKENERRVQTEAEAIELRRQAQEKRDLIKTSKEEKPLSKKELRRLKKEQKSKISSDVDTSTFAIEPQKSSYAVITGRLSETSLSLVESEMEMQADKARLVCNHSTYCPGLRPVLIRLQKLLPGCTIIPGELSQVSCNCETLELIFQRPGEEDYSYKLVARKGHTAQDVFISVSGNTIYTKEIIKANIETAMQKKTEEESESEEQDLKAESDLSEQNRMLSQNREDVWRARQKGQSRLKQACDQELREQRKIKEQSRKLRTKGLGPNLANEHARRDVGIISGYDRGKCAMR